MSDHAEILGLAQEAGIGMTSLPANPDVLKAKIDYAVASFNGEEKTKGDERFLFVLEDTETQKLVGTTGIVAHIGMKYPVYFYKLSTLVQASKDIGVYSRQKVLHMVNDYTGATEIGSLFLQSAYRRDGIGSFLSRCRYLLLAEFPQLFSETVISEIRGVQNEKGDSPFYRNLAEHFFQMDFRRADFINATEGSQFISDLMPKYPIYVNLLDERAKEVIGEPLEASKAAVRLLEAEGFRWQGYIDLFDAGPTLQVERASIRSVRKSKVAQISEIREIENTKQVMLSTKNLHDFRIGLASLEEHKNNAIISPRTAQAMRLKVGDTLRYVDA
jgi:arginine N-succinyltransferase